MLITARKSCFAAMDAVVHEADFTRSVWREIKERGYAGGNTAVTDLLRELRPPRAKGFEVRFETPPGEQAQVGLARFDLEFLDEPRV